MSSFLKFQGRPAMTKVAKNLNRLEALPAQQYDWQILNQHGLGAQLEDSLSGIYNYGMVDDQLINLFKNDQPVYKEMVVEFMASFSFEKPDMDDDERNTLNCIRFRLLGKWKHVSLADFGYLMGLVEANVPFELYVMHLNQSTVRPANFSVTNFWPRISTVEYNSHNSRESHLRTPFIRLLHRYLTWTLLYHKQPEKLNVVQIQGLYYCLNRQPWHIPLVMATLFGEIGRGGYRVLPCGQFVTQIAESLQLLTTDVLLRLSSPLDVSIKGLNVFLTSMILIKDGGVYRLYRDGERKPDDEAGPSQPMDEEEDQGQGHYQAPLPQYDNGLFHVHGRYLDDACAMMMNMDLRAEIRHQTPPMTPYPDHYRNDWRLPRPWGERYDAYEAERRAAYERENEGGDNHDE